MNRRDFIKHTSAAMIALSLPKMTFANSAKITVFYGGPILTMNENNDIAEAIVIEKDKIIGVGTKTDMFKLAGDYANRIDLQGKTLIPGLIDGHSHFPNGGVYDLYYVNLNVPPLGYVTCIADLQERLREKAKVTPKGQLIYGVNYNDLAMSEQRHPTKAELDDVSAEHPIFIKHVSGHLAVANSKGLEIAKITADTQPKTGQINFKTGLLAGSDAQRLFWTPDMPTIQIDYEKAIAFDSNVYASNGVTTANNGGSPTIDGLFLKCSDSDDLAIRVVIWPYAHLNDDIVKTYKNKRSGSILDNKGKVILGAAKLFADGSPQGYTAYFSKPYFKQMSGKPGDYRGFSYFESPEVLMQRIKSLHDNGWQMATHTNGDQAIEDMINAYQQVLKDNPHDDHRHILNHCQFNRPDQVSRIAEIGLIPSYFVTHTYFWGDIHRNYVAGPKMAAHISPCNAALKQGIRFALHNDTPVTPISPLLDVYSAVNRVTSSGYVLGEDQRIGVMDALRGVTINTARMYRIEESIGSLETGKKADMAILSDNPLTMAPEKLNTLTVQATYVDGELVYQA